METATQPMIKANELRLGNWIYSIIETQAAAKKSIIKADEDFLEVLFASRNYDCLEPIPLTHEILEKCGFRKYVDHSGNFYSHNGSYKYYLQKNVFCIFDERSAVHYILDFKYLHQLQNLIFAL